MTRLSSFIRSTPKLFYFVAVLDFLKYTLPLTELYFDGRFNGVDYEVGLRLSIITMVLSAIIYAAGWVAYGVVATLLIALYDEVVALRAAAEDVPNA
jgi:hypothetical protein